MKARYYGFGYRGKTLEDLTELMDVTDADVMDVRFQPFGRSEFGFNSLKERLGGRYHWNKAWGNENYKGKKVQISDFEEGLARANRVREDLILLCACATPAGCHRTVLLDELVRRGHQVQDVDAPPPPPPKREVIQRGLFDLDRNVPYDV